MNLEFLEVNMCEILFFSEIIFNNSLLKVSMSDDVFLDYDK